jgi:trans-aconitate 2-methyltransferase
VARTVWDPAQYGKFGGERERPVHDLLARVPLEAAGRIYDLGCGDGRVTNLLIDRWPGATITGVDNSRAMLAKAREADPETDWIEADIAVWRAPEVADLVFANASMQWVGDHPTLFPRLAAMVAVGGVLAVQMPRNHDAPSHQCMRQAAAAGPWRAKLGDARPFKPVAEPDAYYDILAPHAARLDIWETEYIHVLEGEDPVVEWTKGTGLRPYLTPLDETERAGFLADYTVRIARAYPRRADGRTLLPFRRLFIVALR